ncbi:MAG: hypothetical protein V4681_01140 [Patescibacteria group bacterium]
MRILSRLLDLLFPPRPTAKVVRDASFASIAPLVSPEARSIAGYEGAALLPYRHPLVQALIIEAKYHGDQNAQSLLGAALGDYLSDFLREIQAFSEQRIVLVPIPLGAARLRERGHNQVEAMCTAAIASMGNPPPFETILKRRRDTEPQTTLSKQERAKNLEQAFSADTVDSSCTYIVVDDVTTTGATFRDAVRALHEAGAQHVYPLALAG